MLLAEIVATSGRVASTRSRTAKVAALAELFTRLEPEEVEIAVALATGELRQGKIGVGWATVFGLDVPAAGEPAMSVLALDAFVAQIAALAGAGSAAARQESLARLLSQATADEQEFVRRLLIGELRQGALAGVVTDAVARAAVVPLDVVRRAVMLAGNLPRVAAAALSGGEPALSVIGLEVLRPVLPMLASTSADARAAIEAVGRSSVEWKLDGARVQAHRAGAVVRLFTRNLNDVTDRLPGVAAIVSALPVASVVLDGEVLGVDDDERPDRFQDTMSRFGSHDGTGSTLTAAFFDCLHLDGIDLVDRPLTERIEALETAAGPWRVRSILTDDGDEAQEFLAAALAAGHEGVMVKAASSTYQAGRRGQEWRKVKPVRTLDLVVLAAEWGHGRRRGWLSNIHLGARDPGDPTRFIMVGKTFKGLTDELLTWQTARFQELATDRTDHVVTIRPELVVEIALDGVQASTRYPGGAALRFARVRRYRPDKVAAEADTIDDVRALLT